jgi:polar amino acid transport system substrate-binding protein
MKFFTVLFFLFHPTFPAIFITSTGQPFIFYRKASNWDYSHPSIYYGGNGKFSGLSISSWKLVNQQLNADFEYKVYPSLTDLMKAVETGEVDFSINPITVTDQRMERLAFSQPYFISHTGVAKKSNTSVWTYLANILSWNFISAILILIGVIFIFGFLVWLFERKRNPEQFGGGTSGIFQGFWWSAVTMTTVGYGDKAPLTLGGRVIGLIWMFMAIIMISSLTAGIASSLTVQNIYDEINTVQDLNRFDVVTVSGSSALELLEQYNISSDEVMNEREGIKGVLEDKYSLFVYDQPILKYEIDRRELGDEIEVLPRTLKRDYYSYSFPKNSPLVEVINPLLVATLKTMQWNNLVRDYN